MKSIRDIKDEITDQLSIARDPNEKDMKIKRAKNRVAFLRLCISYIESNPDPAFLEKDLARIDNRISKIMSEYKLWQTENHMPKQFKNEKEMLKWYENYQGIPDLRTRARTIRFILNQ